MAVATRRVDVVSTDEPVITKQAVGGLGKWHTVVSVISGQVSQGVSSTDSDPTSSNVGGGGVTIARDGNGLLALTLAGGSQGVQRDGNGNLITSGV